MNPTGNEISAVLVCSVRQSAPAFAQAERRVVEQVAKQHRAALAPGARVTTMYGPSLPDPNQPADIEGTVRALQMMAGLRGEGYRAEFVEQGGYTFMVVCFFSGRSTGRAPAAGPPPSVAEKPAAPAPRPKRVVTPPPPPAPVAESAQPRAAIPRRVWITIGFAVLGVAVLGALIGLGAWASRGGLPAVSALFATATPTLTPTPTPLPGPAAGHWEGDSVSLDVNAAGDIEDFRMSVPFGFGMMGQNYCTVTAEMVVVEDDHTFLLQGWANFGGGSADVLAHAFRGQFDSPTAVSGTYRASICGSTMIAPASEGTWSAQWTEPAVAAGPTAAPSPTPTSMPTRPAATSTTTARVTVPSVVVLPVQFAVDNLEKVGLQAELVVEQTAACSGLVTRQDPAMGTEVAAGSTVKIYACAKPTPVPATPVVVAENAVFLDPFCNCEKDVTAGEAPYLRWTWLATTEQLLRYFLEASRSTVTIDGKAYGNLEGYWSEPAYRSEYSGYGSTWAYPLPALAPGKHRVELSMWLSSMVSDGYDENNDGQTDQYGPGNTFYGYVDVRLRGASTVPTAAACANGAPAGMWLLRVMKTGAGDGVILTDGQEHAIHSGENAVYLTAGVSHAVLVGSSTINFSAAACDENTLQVP